MPVPRNLFIFLLALPGAGLAQLAWNNRDTSFPGLPSGIHVYQTHSLLSGRPNHAWYVMASLQDRSLQFDVDSTLRRRSTPAQFQHRNPTAAIVVNGTFFSFADHKNLNVLIRRGRLLGYNIMSIPGRGKDTLSYHHVTRSAIGIDRQRRADVAWLYTDSNLRYPLAYAEGPAYGKGAQTPLTPSDLHSATTSEPKPRRWKMVTAIGGGPVLIHQGVLRITNDEERMFMGKAREDLHPRTAMGYTRDGQLLMVVVEGRRPGKAEGASLTDLARIMLDLGAVEALNLDGGGSSCLLVMGKETIRPSDKEGQRAVPGVFIIKSRPIR